MPLPCGLNVCFWTTTTTTVRRVSMYPSASDKRLWFASEGPSYICHQVDLVLAGSRLCLTPDRCSVGRTHLFCTRRTFDGERSSHVWEKENASTERMKLRLKVVRNRKSTLARMLEAGPLRLDGPGDGRRLLLGSSIRRWRRTDCTRTYVTKHPS